MDWSTKTLLPLTIIREELPAMDHSLDEQNERILERLKAVQQLVVDLKEGFTKVLEAMETEEWKPGFVGTPKRSKR